MQNIEWTSYIDYGKIQKMHKLLPCDGTKDNKLMAKLTEHLKKLLLHNIHILVIKCQK